MAEITIPDNNARIQYTSSAGQTVFPYDFPIFNADHLIVQHTAALNGVTTTLTNTIDYTVDGVGVAGGGNVTIAGTTALNDIVTIERNAPIERVTDFLQGGDYRAESINQELDVQIMMMQQNARDIARCLRLASEDTAISQTLPLNADRANKILGFDANGNPVAAIPVSSILTASDIPNTPSGNISATNVQAAINELDLEKASLVSSVNSFGQAITYTADQGLIGRQLLQANITSLRSIMFDVVGAYINEVAAALAPVARLSGFGLSFGTADGTVVSTTGGFGYDFGNFFGTYVTSTTATPITVTPANRGAAAAYYFAQV